MTYTMSLPCMASFVHPNTFSLQRCFIYPTPPSVEKVLQSAVWRGGRLGGRAKAKVVSLGRGGGGGGGDRVVGW